MSILNERVVFAGPEGSQVRVQIVSFLALRPPRFGGGYARLCTLNLLDPVNPEHSKPFRPCKP